MTDPSLAYVLATWVVRTVGAYLLLGVLFALPFAAVGAARLDPAARGSGWGFRLLILPGAMAFWPLLLGRWMRGATQPPEECNAHRQASSREPQP